jgi:hypothetical protein
MKSLIVAFLLTFFTSALFAEYEMHIPNCTQKGVENCGGFLFDNETGDVLFCGSESCIDLKLPKSWREKQKEKQSKQDQIIEMLGDIQSGSIIMNNSNATQQVVSTPVEEKQKEPEKKIIPEKDETTAENKKADKKEEKCDKEKKSLCEASGGMQLGGTKMKLKKPSKK